LFDLAHHVGAERRVVKDADLRVEDARVVAAQGVRQILAQREDGPPHLGDRVVETAAFRRDAVRADFPRRDGVQRPMEVDQGRDGDARCGGDALELL